MTNITNLYANQNTISSLYGTSSTQQSSSASSQQNLLSSVIGNYGKNNANALSNSLQSYLSTTKAASTALRPALDDMMGRTKNSSKLYNQTKVQSSDESAIGITADATATLTSALKDAKFSVSKIATAQTNEGKAMDASAISFSPGTPQSLKITGANGRTETFTVNPKVAQTNQKVQQQLADQINNAKMDISAKVELDEKTKQSRLVITSAKTGAANGFTVSGDLADALKVNTATKTAQNAVYSVDGTQKESASNTIELAKGVTATLKTATTKDVTLTQAKDSTNLINSTREMVNGYNKLLEAAKESAKKDSGAGRLYDTLSGLTQAYANSLGKAGITANDSGYLEIDEKKMKEAGDNGALEALAGKQNGYANFGFTSRLEQTASKIASDPSSFLSSTAKRAVKDATTDNGFSSYLSSKSDAQKASFASRLNKSYSMGMLFDSMF